MPKEKIKIQIYLRPSKHTITEVPPLQVVRRSRGVCIRKQISKVKLPYSA